MQPIYASQTGTGSSDWKMVSADISPANFGVAVTVSGTVTYTFEYTYDDPSQTYPSPGGAVTAFQLAALTSKSANTDSSIAFPIYAWRVTVTAGSGTATARVVQAGIAGN